MQEQTGESHLRIVSQSLIVHQLTFDIETQLLKFIPIFKKKKKRIVSLFATVIWDWPPESGAQGGHLVCCIHKDCDTRCVRKLLPGRHE